MNLLGHHQVVSVVAGGWSFSKVSHHDIPGAILAVNDSAIYLRRKLDVILSMDRLWTEGRWAQLCELRVPTWLRASTVRKVDWQNQPWVYLYECNNESVELSDDRFRLNGTNSGVCAVNLASTLQPRIIYLFGFDMQPGPHGEKHWYPDYPWGGGTSKRKYVDWSREFARIREQCNDRGVELINVTDRSVIDSLPTMTVEDLREAQQGFVLS